MRKPPAIAMVFLTRLGPQDDAVVGDIVEEYGTGRSRWWLWQQVVAAVVFGALRTMRARPLRTAGAVVTGWAVALVLFAVFGDRVADGLARLVWGWDRQMAYAGEQTWWPFHVTATFVSYAGFAIAAVVVARAFRATPGMLLAFASSVTVAMALTAATLEILFRRVGAVPLPHAFFYVASVTLPYQLRSGLLLVPLVVVVCGMAVRPRLAIIHDHS
jgi:hypothetical protein